MTTALRWTGPAPTAGLLDTVLISTWLETAPPGPVAVVLLAHPPARSDDQGAEQEERMRGLGAALGLEPVSSRLPDIGARITAHPGVPLTLDVAPCGCGLALPPTGRDFTQFVADGGPVIVTLGLDPLDGGADRTAIDAYLYRSLLADRLAMGTTRRRR